jgi:hypothetical protein
MKKGDKIYIKVVPEEERVAYDEKEMKQNLDEANFCSEDVFWEATLVKKFVVKDNNQSLEEVKK